MATYKDIFYEKKDHVARITINRPKQYNAFTGDTLKELTLAFEAAGGDGEVGVGALTGTGEKGFPAGGAGNGGKGGGVAGRWGENGERGRGCGPRRCSSR